MLLRVRFLRLSQGRSQWELSRAAGLSQTRLSMLERGQILPKTIEREALAAALSAPASSLFRPVTNSRPKTLRSDQSALAAG